jgi:hypothetical protein
MTEFRSEDYYWYKESEAVGFGRTRFAYASWYMNDDCPLETKPGVDALRDVYLKKTGAEWVWRRLFTAYYNNVVDYVGNYQEPLNQTALQSLFDWAQGKADELLTGVEEGISEAYVASEQAVSGMYNSLYDTVDTGLSDFWDLFGSAEEAVSGLYNSGMNKVNSVYTIITDKISELYGVVTTDFQNVTGLVDTYITNMFTKSVDGMDTLFTDIAAKFNVLTDGAGEAVEFIARKIAKSLDVYVNELGVDISTSVDALQDLAEEWGRSSGKIMSQLGSDISPKLAVLAELAKYPLGISESEESVDAIQSLNNNVRTAFEELIDPNDSLIDAVRRIVDADGGSTVLGKFVSVIMSLVITAVHTMQGVNILASPRAIKGLQEVNRTHPVVNYPESTSLNLYARRHLSIDSVVEALSMEGYDTDKISTMAVAAFQTLDIERLAVARNRGIMDEEQYRQALENIGIREDHIDIIDNLRYVLPPVQDLITMAVREVFSPDIADTFGLFGDLPEEFVAEAAKQGLTEEWAKRYWGAHWRLPSAQQGFEMYHRGVVDEDTLKLLLRALDVSPFWRDKLQAIAYNPVTRVDIRRIYQMGLLSREEVYRRHLDIGYSPVDAELLTEFTIRYIDIEEDTDDVDPKLLAMSQIKRLHELGTIKTGDAITQLVALKYSIDAATLLVQSWSIEVDVSFRENMIKRYVNKAIRDDLDERGVETLFADLSLTTEEMRRVKQVVAIERNEYDAVPSKTELRDMLRAGLIAYEVWFSGMRKHGYTEEWISAYFKLYKLG